MKLRGLRVVDLCQFLPGPHLSMMMADHGAEVIKVEPPGAGDPTRSLGPGRDGHAQYFRNVNRGKKSIALDLKNPDGREALLRVLETADVALEAFRPGVAARLGVGYDAVRARNPRIVYASISAFGQTGSMRDSGVHDMSIQAMAGPLSQNVDSAGRPVVPGMASADMSASLMALSGILMALLRARDTGEGDYLDIAMHDTLLAWTPHMSGPVLVEGRAPLPGEERTQGGAALYQIYETADAKWITLGGSEVKFAVNLLTALGRPDLIETAKLPAGPAQRPLRDFLAATFLARTQAEWVQWFEGRDIAFAPMLDLKQAFEKPLVAERDMLLTDEAGNKHIGVPIKFREEPARPGFALSQLGADGPAILAGIGYDAGAIDRMIASGALHVAATADGGAR